MVVTYYEIIKSPLMDYLHPYKRHPHTTGGQLTSRGICDHWRSK